MPNSPLGLACSFEKYDFDLRVGDGMRTHGAPDRSAHGQQRSGFLAQLTTKEELNDHTQHLAHF